MHTLTGTTKLAFFLLFTFASMITYDTWVLHRRCWRSAWPHSRLSRIRFREVRFMLVFMLVFLLLNNLFIFLFDPDQGTDAVRHPHGASATCSGGMTITWRAAVLHCATSR